jgi:hypothetical protein
VVVAAGAPDRLPEERLAERVELLVDHVHPELLLVLLLQVRVAQGQEAGGGQLPPALLGRCRPASGRRPPAPA